MRRDKYNLNNFKVGQRREIAVPDKTTGVWLLGRIRSRMYKKGFKAETGMEFLDGIWCMCITRTA